MRILIDPSLAEEAPGPNESSPGTSEEASNASETSDTNGAFGSGETESRRCASWTRTTYDYFADKYEKMTDMSPSSAEDTQGFPQNAIWIDVDGDFLTLTSHVQLAENFLQTIVPYSEAFDSQVLRSFLAAHGFRFRFPLLRSDFVAFYEDGNWQQQGSSEHGD